MWANGDVTRMNGRAVKVLNTFKKEVFLQFCDTGTTTLENIAILDGLVPTRQTRVARSPTPQPLPPAKKKTKKKNLESTFVYLFKVGTIYKIGKTKNLEKRRKILSCASGTNISILKAWKFDKDAATQNESSVKRFLKDNTMLCEGGSTEHFHHPAGEKSAIRMISRIVQM